MQRPVTAEKFDAVGRPGMPCSHDAYFHAISDLLYRVKLLEDWVHEAANREQVRMAQEDAVVPFVGGPRGPIAAIRFAQQVGQTDPYAALNFLHAWEHGETSEWPEFGREG